MKELLTSADNKKTYACSGVYLWEEPCPAGLCVSYVGQSRNLWYRQLEHYWYQLGSAYLLPGKYRECGEDWSLDLSRRDVQETLFDLTRFTKLVRENFAYMQSIRLHLALTEDPKVVEANLIYQLQPIGNARYKKTAPATVVDFEHLNKKWTPNNSAERTR